MTIQTGSSDTLIIKVPLPVLIPILVLEGLLAVNKEGEGGHGHQKSA